jgi:hypothetical protein
MSYVHLPGAISVWELGRDGDDGPFEYTEVELQYLWKIFSQSGLERFTGIFSLGGLTPKILITEEVFRLLTMTILRLILRMVSESLDAEFQQAGGQKR